MGHWTAETRQAPTTNPRITQSQNTPPGQQAAKQPVDQPHERRTLIQFQTFTHLGKVGPFANLLPTSVPAWHHVVLAAGAASRPIAHDFHRACSGPASILSKALPRRRIHRKSAPFLKKLIRLTSINVGHAWSPTPE